jgi:hypothetical protein
MLTLFAPVQTRVAETSADAPEVQQLFVVVGVALAVAVGLLVFLALLRRFLFVCRPNELLVIAG